MVARFKLDTALHPEKIVAEKKVRRPVESRAPEKKAKQLPAPKRTRVSEAHDLPATKGAELEDDWKEF
jgi:hypothetical protein